MNTYEKLVKDFEKKVLAGEKVGLTKAVRIKCLDYMGYQPNEVRACPNKDCSLYPFRFGKNPFYIMSEKRREAGKRAGERLRKFRLG